MGNHQVANSFYYKTMILPLAIFFSMGRLEASLPEEVSSYLRPLHNSAPLEKTGHFDEISHSSEPASAQSASALDEKIQTIFRTFSEKALFLGAGTVLESASILARLGWGLCLMSPWASTIGNECLLLSHVFDCTAQHVFAYIFKRSPSPPPFFKNAPLSQQSWYLNQALLSQIPISSPKEKQLLLFLEKRWLAKSSGFYSSVVDWVCPCFGVSVQVDPGTTGFYARDPGKKSPPAYVKRVEDWKQSLPHPQNFPLLLTRPFDLRDHLPSYLDVPPGEKIQTTIERLMGKIKTVDTIVVVDVTRIFPEIIKNREGWLQTWKAYQAQFIQACKEQAVQPNQILCIQTVQQEEIGGLRLLPLDIHSVKDVDQHHQFLLEWISLFGLSANRVELDRWPLPSNTSIRAPITSFISMPSESKEELIAYLESYDQQWKSSHPQKTLMVKGTLQILKGLFAALSKDQWDELINSPTRSAIAHLSFLKIKHQLKFLAQKEDELLFFEIASLIEQIHADLSTLLEICSPFTYEDFPTIYRDLLTSIPVHLKPLASYGLHTSGMTSLAGIFKAVERMLGKPPYVLYGENAYFENIHAANLVSNARSIQESTETDWKDVDLILAQFNPALKRIDFQITEYRVEAIAETLHKSLNRRQGKRLTLAIDCTFDFIDSPQVAHLLAEFQEEVEKGILNIICYRSGLKFDLFGMDNYCGAPFFMLHNQDIQWASFDSLLTDPVLQTDRLSLNWFCVAYQNAAPQLELYRKQIFTNTRALLNKVPPRLLTNKNVAYRIIPMEEKANLAFIDIKVLGPFHEMRASFLIGGGLTTHCMSGAHPIFYRSSVGFYHPNFTILFGKECSTIRLTLGLDPAQVDLIAEFFAKMDKLNGSSHPKRRTKI